LTARKPKITFTEEEYLILEGAATFKNEFIEGKINEWGDQEESNHPSEQPKMPRLAKDPNQFLPRQNLNQK